MFSTIKLPVIAALLTAGSALLLPADQARAQNGPCQGRQTGQTGQTGLQQNGQLNRFQQQTLRQQRIALITQLRTSQQNGQLTQTQVQTLLQQLRTGQLTATQLQTLLQQLQNGQTALQQTALQQTALQQTALQQTAQVSRAQLRTLRQQRLALIGQVRTLQQNGALTQAQLQALSQQILNVQNSWQLLLLQQNGLLMQAQLQALSQQFQDIQKQLAAELTSAQPQTLTVENPSACEDNDHVVPLPEGMRRSPGERSRTHYRLLGITPNERDPATLEEAALARAARARAYQLTHPQECTRLLNDIARALATLLDPSKRAEYDAGLSKPPVGEGANGRGAWPPEGSLDVSLVPIGVADRLLCDVALVCPSFTAKKA